MAVALHALGALLVQLRCCAAHASDALAYTQCSNKHSVYIGLRCCHRQPLIPVQGTASVGFLVYMRMQADSACWVNSCTAGQDESSTYAYSRVKNCWYRRSVQAP